MKTLSVRDLFFAGLNYTLRDSHTEFSHTICMCCSAKQWWSSFISSRQPVVSERFWFLHLVERIAYIYCFRFRFVAVCVSLSHYCVLWCLQQIDFRFRGRATFWNPFDDLTEYESKPTNNEFRNDSFLHSQHFYSSFRRRRQQYFDRRSMIGNRRELDQKEFMRSKKRSRDRVCVCLRARFGEYQIGILRIYF